MVLQLCVVYTSTCVVCNTVLPQLIIQTLIIQTSIIQAPCYITFDLNLYIYRGKLASS